MTESRGRNVLGGELEECGTDPLTGYTRSGACEAIPAGGNLHTICTVVTADFLKHQRQIGNDLITPRPAWGFRGLRPGDRWCVIAPRWVQSHQFGRAAPVVLAATHEAALAHVSLDTLRSYAVDVPDDLSALGGTSGPGSLGLPYRILVVCTGNTCRSAMAEFVFRAALYDAGIGDRAVVSSAGIWTGSDEAAMDPRARRVLERHGVADTGFADKQAIQFEASHFDEADLILVADALHLDALKSASRTPTDLGKVWLVRSFDPAATLSGHLEIDDPWDGTEQDYERTFDEISGASEGLVAFVREALDRKP